MPADCGVVSTHSHITCAFQLLFSVTFALSISMLELTIFEIGGIFEATSRFTLWQWTLQVLPRGDLVYSFTLPP